MSFIRLKRVGKDRYAYLVDNEWTPKGPRQKVKRYLGRYIELPPSPAPSIPVGTPATPGALVSAELATHGFPATLKKDGITVNLRTCTVKQGIRNVVLGINGGFLCSYSLRKLLHFTPIVEVTPGYALARAFSDAGIRVTREQFVAAYTKAYKRSANPE